ncbi:hypothetical protein DB44_DJ00180 [Candidatus Protochlamydia amoebophila]|uniref:Uncharacterized protein n=1 Tax=Candidatus Protochlamydia amoebophila TaxID=362787 RepID=A0A0C1H9H8_9BACT|nr:hypothetical protein DB44_DJ00180 [Candidatus Protochlamydia amoebophila]
MRNLIFAITLKELVFEKLTINSPSFYLLHKTTNLKKKASLLTGLYFLKF